MQIDFRMLIDMLSVGIPSGLICVLDSGMFAVGTFMMASFGVIVLAAQSIAMQMASVMYAIPFGLSMAVALSVGNAIGAKDFKKAKQIGYLGLGLGFIAAILISIFFVGFPDMIIHMFLKENVADFQEIQQLATNLFMIAAVFQTFDMMQAVMNGALRGYKDTFKPFLFCTLGFWGVGIGSAYFFGFHTHFGALGVWMGLTLGLMSASVALLLRFMNK
jgi:MATE family multidrug resistance protein